VTPNDPRHGTYAGAQQHRRDNEPFCVPCHTSFRNYQRLHANERLLGHRRTTPTAPITAYLRRLVAAGMTTQSIADRSGVGRATVQDILTRPRPTLRTDNAQALLGVEPTGVRTGSVPSTGTIRRVKALGRLGWSTTVIAETAREHDPTLPITSNTLRQLLSNQPPVVRPRTAVAVELAYAELSMRLPATDRHSTQVRDRAERKGWPPPLAWDAIDDPNETPTGWEYDATDGRAERIRELTALGENVTQVARAVGLNQVALLRWCRSHGLRDEYRALASREGDWNSPGNYAHTSKQKREVA
jgi:hypothetical protein